MLLCTRVVMIEQAGALARLRMLTLVLTQAAKDADMVFNSPTTSLLFSLNYCETIDSAILVTLSVCHSDMVRQF